MPWTPTLTELRDLLADLYDDAGDRRRVAVEAGLPVKGIDFAGTSVVAWQHILETAQKHGRLAAIVAIARGEFFLNVKLVATLDRIGAQLAAEEVRNDPKRPDQKVIRSSVKVAWDESKPKPAVQVRQRARRGCRRLLLGSAVAIAAVTVIVLVRIIILPRDPVILTGDTMTVTSPIKMELVRVPAGEFLMGSDPAKDSQAFDRDLPQHRVTLSEYYIGKYEVTNAQYQAFVQAIGYAVPSYWENGSIPVGKDDHPVVNVTWNDTIAFADWLSTTTGLACRLPTEAEWEKACRGPEGLIYPWGDSPPDFGRANFNNNVGDTTSVGSYSPKGDSVYGAVDIAGNVWEWTGSLWGRDSQKPDYGYPYDPMDGREDLDAPSNVWRVVRGGSFDFNDMNVRCAYRLRGSPYLQYDDIGFRVMCVSPP